MDIRGMRKAGFILILAVFGFIRILPAQDTGGYYLLPGVSQQSFFNPASQNKSAKLVIGIPLLSGIHGNWSLSTPLNSLFSEGFSYSFERFYDALGQRGKATVSGSLSMFYAALRTRDYSISLSVSERMFSTGAFDRGIVKLIRDGTANYFGSSEDFGATSFHLNYYRELALGVSKTIWDELHVGIRPKILFGKIFFDTRDLQFSVETDTENNELLLQPEGSYTFSGPFQKNGQVSGVSSFSAHVLPGDYFFQPRNLGVAIDLGAVFRPAEFYEFSFSLLDAGFAGFKHNTFNVDFSGSSRFSENTLYQSHTPGEANYREPREAIKAFGDSVSYIIDVAEANERTLTLLPFHLNVSGKYRFSKTFSAGINNRFSSFEKQTWNVFSAFVQAVPHKRVELAGSLSFIDFSFLRPGIGVNYTLEMFQFFFSSNNILGIIQPSASKHLNLHFGINLLFDTK